MLKQTLVAAAEKDYRKLRQLYYQVQEKLFEAFSKRDCSKFGQLSLIEAKIEDEIFTLFMEDPMECDHIFNPIHIMKEDNCKDWKVLACCEYKFRKLKQQAEETFEAL